MTNTPEERRETQETALVTPGVLPTQVGLSPSTAIDRLLAYFDKNEPALADAIRYGLAGTTVISGEIYHNAKDVSDKELFYINYPEGHPK